jgi:hypothetical protein
MKKIVRKGDCIGTKNVASPQPQKRQKRSRQATDAMRGIFTTTAAKTAARNRNFLPLCGRKRGPLNGNFELFFNICLDNSVLVLLLLFI